jgi:hypothetical protein
MTRSSDGKMRVDFGNTSVISDPTGQKSILLDHLKKQAMTIPMPQGPQFTPPVLPAGAMPSAGTPPNVLDLGKALIGGHEVEGKQYTFQPPQMPTMPAMPKQPALPKMPQAPGMPQAPQMPQAPPMPTVAQVWTSTKTKLPVLTKITGPFGEQICHCQTAPTFEPPPSTFQVPQGYQMVPMPSAPKPPLPSMPAAPQLPKFPR